MASFANGRTGKRNLIMDKPELTPSQLSEELSTELILKLQQLGFRISGPACKVICTACDKVAKEVSTKKS
jgi:hypothetical protein